MASAPVQARCEAVAATCSSSCFFLFIPEKALPVIHTIKNIATRSEAGGAVDDLLDSFNVADFNTSVLNDDASFWERLIPSDER